MERDCHICVCSHWLYSETAVYFCNVTYMLVLYAHLSHLWVYSLSVKWIKSSAHVLFSPQADSGLTTVVFIFKCFSVETHLNTSHTFLLVSKHEYCQINVWSECLMCFIPPPICRHISSILPRCSERCRLFFQARLQEVKPTSQQCPQMAGKLREGASDTFQSNRGSSLGQCMSACEKNTAHGVFGFEASSRFVSLHDSLLSF